ncbi:HEAT repeat domain-containing protein [Desulfovibrio oxyclinae]|jgi:CheY-like chemotaxis protein|uniref:HEAT repeat domain-containing protein n=1 Tax=Desulfovibrio oxyclinae TaxID=63560 RepID=UPI000374DBB8|nr:HEAT repeat domain-containing protein [Desulfovibrio oxyclinae]
MSILDDFRSKEFLDQITILNEVAGSKDPQTLPGLIDLLKVPVGDTSIDYMVVNALNAVLSQDPERTVRGLSDEHAGFRTLCIRVAGEHRFEQAAPVLASLAENEEDPDRLMEVLTSLAHIGDPATLPTFRKFLNNEDPFIQALCIEALGKLNDHDSIPELKGLVEESEAPERYEVCEITTWKSIEALASIQTDDTLRFLVDKLHHKNPTVRRIITDAMISIGSPVIPLLLEAFETGDDDHKVLAANVLGFIGDKSCADGLVAAFDKGLAETPNVRYALYEALGRVGTMKGIICLVDGLNETEELTLMAVITGLEKHVNPGMVNQLTKMLSAADDQAERLAKAIVNARATRLFDALYESAGAGDMLVDALAESRDQEVLDEFKGLLVEIGGARADEDLARLPDLEESTRKALAADDSRSMCAMHRAILTDLGFEPFIASNGQEAFEFIERGEDFDIILTDMNMPVMDGMELVGKIRNTPGFEDTPIIMVTTESEGSQQSLAEKTGVTTFITKPFKPHDLKTKINDLLA